MKAYPLGQGFKYTPTGAYRSAVATKRKERPDCLIECTSLALAIPPTTSTPLSDKAAQAKRVRAPGRREPTSPQTHHAKVSIDQIKRGKTRRVSQGHRGFSSTERPTITIKPTQAPETCKEILPGLHPHPRLPVVLVRHWPHPRRPP